MIGNYEKYKDYNLENPVEMTDCHATTPDDFNVESQMIYHNPGL